MGRLSPACSWAETQGLMSARTLFLLMLMCLLIASCGEPGPTPTPTSTPTVGDKVAVIDGKSMDSAYANRVDYLVRNLAPWCSLAEERVADMALVSRDALLEDFGIDLDVLDVLEEVNESASGTQSSVLRDAKKSLLFISSSGGSETLVVS